MYVLDSISQVVAPFGVSFRDVLAGKDTLSQYVASILSVEDMAVLSDACAAELAEDFEADRAEAQFRSVCRKFARAGGHEKVESADAESAREWLDATSGVAETAVLVLGTSEKASVSIPLESVREGDYVAEVKVVVSWRKFGKPARVIDPNLNNGL